MSDAAKAVWLTIGFVLLIAVIVVLGGLITMWAWNFGVLALVAACGGTVTKIGLGTAIWVNIALGIIKYRGTTDSPKSSKS